MHEMQKTVKNWRIFRILYFFWLSGSKTQGLTIISVYVCVHIHTYTHIHTHVKYNPHNTLVFFSSIGSSSLFILLKHWVNACLIVKLYYLYSALKTIWFLFQLKITTCWYLIHLLLWKLYQVTHSILCSKLRLFSYHLCPLDISSIFAVPFIQAL